MKGMQVLGLLSIQHAGRVRTGEVMETLFKDLRYGFRSLLRQPAFTLVAVATLALAIGSNSAMFTVVNAVLLQPLHYPESDRIVALEGINPAKGIAQSNMSIPDFADWQNQNQVFERMAGFVTGGIVFSNGEETERVHGTAVSSDFFPLFRVAALRGRALQADDMQAGKDPVAVIGYGLWQRRFGGDADVVGSKAMISGKSTMIVGVMPQGFDYPVQSEAWVPLPIDPAKEARDNRFINVIARLRPGADVPQSQAQLDTINQRLAQSYNETNSGWTVKVRTLQEGLVGNVRLSLLVLLCAVVFVLLIACANVANLLLARATARQKEIAVRAALGASRLRIVRQLLTESLLLSVLGGLAGLLLSIWLTRLLIAVSPANTPRFDEIRPDARVLMFTITLTLITGVIFGLVPALQASRSDQAEGLKKGSRGNTSGRNNRVRGLLMVAEIAMSFVLLVGAGLLIKSFIRLREVNAGFNPENLLTLRLAAPPGKFRDDETRIQFFRQAIDHIQATPGVQSAGMVLSLPLGGDTFNVWRGYIPEGRPATPEEAGDAAYLVATPEYFRALQIPLIAGRMFEDRDNANAPKIVIVNETMARKLWPGQSPIGKHIAIWRDEKFSREIIGVVGETKAALDNQPGEQMYVPYTQDPGWSSMSFVVRTSGDPASAFAAIRNEIRSIDKGAPIFNVRPMSEVLATSVAPRRTPMLLLSAFAGAALLLAMIGIYGVTAYYVTQRTQEIGIRMALGAQMRDVLALVLKSGMVLTAIGIVTGLAGAFAVTRWMRTLLFAVNPTDFLTLMVVSGCVLITTLLACYFPARRATKVDPLVALRYE
jgi:putative ABC transport system permease protein